MKATSGRTDEAIIDALVAFKLRAPSVPGKSPTGLSSAAPNASQESNPGSNASVAPAPPYWKASSWRLAKHFMDSMGQLGHLYYLQGSVSESRYYYSMGLQLAQRYANANAEFRFAIQLAQLDLESGHAALSTNNDDPGSVVPSQPNSLPHFDAVTLLDQHAAKNPHLLSLISASAHATKANALLRSGSHDMAREAFQEAERLLLELIDVAFVECLDPRDATKPAATKAPARGRATKRSNVEAIGADPAGIYRFSMSPAKLPKPKSGGLPSDYIGIKRIQLRIGVQLAMVDYHKAQAEPGNAEALLDAASAALDSLKTQLEDLSQCPAVQLDLAITMLHQAKVLIAQSALNASNASLWDPIASSKASAAQSAASAAPSTKKVAAKSKKVVDKVTLAREILNSAFGLSISGGSVPKITSDICQYSVEISGLLDTWSTIARQNSAIGITMRHQILANIYRLGIMKGEQEEQVDDSEGVEALTEAMKSQLSIASQKMPSEGSDEQYHAHLRQILEELDFENDKVGGEDFKERYVDVLGACNSTKPYTVCTVSLGPDNRSLVISRLKYGEEALICRVDVSGALDELTLNSFAVGTSMDINADNDPEIDEDTTPVLIRSATALLGPLLASGQPSLKRSASCSQPSSLLSQMVSQSLQEPDNPPKSIASKSVKGTAAKRVGLSASGARSGSAAKKSGATAKTAKKAAIKSIDEIGTKELNEMLSNLSVTGEIGEEDGSSSSLSSSVGSVGSSESSQESSCKGSAFKRFTEALQSIINDSNAIAVTSATKNDPESSKQQFNHQWWTKRFALDDRMNAWLSNFEGALLSSYKTIFAGQLADQSLLDALENQMSELQAQVEKTLKVPKGTLPFAYFRALVLGADGSSTKNLVDAIQRLVGWNEKMRTPTMSQALKSAALLIQDTWVSLSAHDSNAAYQVEQSEVISALDQQWMEQNDVDVPDLEDGCLVRKRTIKRQRRHPVILILDKQLHSLPWESLPVLRSNPVSRMPSLFALRASIVTELQESSPSSVVRDGLDSEKVFYIINPSKDLQTSQEMLHPFVQANPSWNGLIGEKPSPGDYMKALEESNLLIYAGHNSGMQYLNGESAELRKVRHKAGGCAVWMMGCASAKVTEHSDFDPSGMVLTYLMSGSPSVVGNLWAVTTRDLDKATVSMLQWLKNDSHGSVSPSGGSQLNSSSTLADAILQARQACKLQYINAAALISYGLPLKVNRKEASSPPPTEEPKSRASSRATSKSTTTSASTTRGTARKGRA
jgi:tetratricopeptide (TPR) repeat protein